MSPGGWARCARAYWRRRWRPLWRAVEWPVIGGLAVAAVGLGAIGFHLYFAARQSPRSAADLFYLSLQLFSLESGALEPPLPWQLEVARLLAPATAVYTALGALARLFREQLQLLRLRFARDHVIVCGLGSKGQLLAQAFLELGRRVVVIEQDPGNAAIEECRELGITVLAGNATDRVLLRAARVDRACYLVAVCGDDGANAEVAVGTRGLVRDRPRGTLTAYVHLVDLALCNLMREKEIALQRDDAFRAEFFNVFEVGARALLNDHPAFGSAEYPYGFGPGQAERPHLLVIGMGQMGKSLVVHAARTWRALRPEAGERLRVTAVDRDAALKAELLGLRYPLLAGACDLAARSVDVRSPEFERADFLLDGRGRTDVTAIYVCLDDDARGLAAALALLQRLRQQPVPIVVRMTVQDAGLATLLRGEGLAGFETLRAFGLLDRTCTPELLLGGTHEILARSIHEHYVRQQASAGHTPATNPSMVGWEDLPEALKESNRRNADDIGSKLLAVGCGIRPLTDWDAALAAFTPAEVERLAEMEHDRWVAERRRDGWTYAPGPKDVARKRTPYLVPWDQLAETTRDNDRALVRGLPASLARAGFQVYRLAETAADKSHVL